MIYPEETNFGFKKVPSASKPQLISQLFAKVAPKYDLMNDIMSWGLHRLWKKFLLPYIDAQNAHKILDVAAGTADLSLLIAEHVKVELFLLDLNQEMLSHGRAKLINHGVLNASYMAAAAEKIPAIDNYFDRIVIGFGFRNFTSQAQSISELYRVLKWGGKLIILEFSDINHPWFKSLYSCYANNIISRLGDEYKYLVESIAVHTPKEQLTQLLQKAGFIEVSCHSLHYGLVAIHCGYKF